ncbi:MAG: DNA-directed RNA polymerase subunit D [Candidatus Micrarchaeota archaeon]
MKIIPLHETSGRLTVHLQECTPAAANALRRAVIDDMPAFAIDEVDFFENNSCAYNEYLANRLALVPLTFDDEAGEDAKIVFSLDKEGPCTVYSHELRSTDEKIKVFCKNIPLVKLGERQRLRLEATAVRGTARQHAKFQSALASYCYYPEIKVKKGEKKLAAAAEACPRKIIAASGELVHPERCDLCNACKDAAPEAVSVKGREDEFIFFVETYNNVPAGQQLKRALAILTERCAALAKEA